jgi:RNA polymerase sigma-70 factor (sigma-E family)
MSAARDDFTAFVVAHEAALLRTAHLLTGDRGHAEDLVQTALARAYRHWGRVQRADVPIAYVRTLLVNTHLSWRRRLWHTEQVLEALPERAGEDPQARHALTDELRRALEQLSPRCRAVLVLRFYEDLTETETAQALGCSTSTVRTHTARGLDAVRAALRPEPATTLSDRRTS